MVTAAVVAYFFGKEMWDTGAGLVAAALIAIFPGYISRSVDNEAVAIFALLLKFYLFVKAVCWVSTCSIWRAYGCLLVDAGVFVPNLFEDNCDIGYSGWCYCFGCWHSVWLYISPCTGRFYSLLDPTHAKHHIPIIASVSEHQPTAWSSFMFDYHILLFLFPAGLYFCFKRLSDATIFIVMYGLTSLYFAGVMVRLIFVATPAICLISAIAVSATVKNLTSLLRAKQKVPQTGSSKGPGSSKASSKVTLDQAQPFQKNGAIALLVGVFYLLSRYAIHCTWVTSEAYSSPSIVLAARGAHGNRIIFDDYCEAYYWLTQNTPTDAKVMSWWDYGYQITAMGNRTVIVDNNTWNNTHIAT
ncbi:hypothetical protein F2Q70_00022269, partial [Brassica cretica]